MKFYYPTLLSSIGKYQNNYICVPWTINDRIFNVDRNYINFHGDLFYGKDFYGKDFNKFVRRVLYK